MRFSGIAATGTISDCGSSFDRWFLLNILGRPFGSAQGSGTTLLRPTAPLYLNTAHVIIARIQLCPHGSSQTAKGPQHSTNTQPNALSENAGWRQRHFLPAVSGSNCPGADGQVAVSADW